MTTEVFWPSSRSAGQAGRFECGVVQSEPCYIGPMGIVSQHMTVHEGARGITMHRIGETCPVQLAPDVAYVAVLPHLLGYVFNEGLQCTPACHATFCTAAVAMALYH